MRPTRLLEGLARVRPRVLAVAQQSVQPTEPEVPGAGECGVVDAGQQGGGPERREALGRRAHEVQGLRPAQHELEVNAIALTRGRRTAEGVERLLQGRGSVAVRIAAGRLL